MDLAPHLSLPIGLADATSTFADPRVLLGLLASYLLGAVPFGFVMVRLVKGVDLRTVGSGNIGATNAMRVLGRPLGLVAFLLDLAKGWVPAALFAPWSTGHAPFASDVSVAVPVLFGAAAVVGHVLPVYLRFKGGKAVATGCGALIAIDPLVFLVGGASWLVALGLSRMVSVASLAMAVAFAAAAWWRAPAHVDGAFLGAGSSALAVLILWRHRSNIGRILKGTEPRIGARRAAPDDSNGPAPTTTHDQRTTR
ncbi:Glycerol-3-phosphate acyltransferase [Planctomycetes bacterium Pla163]|uniref:Glycerol-3-phosphate acyltransferase n=1 Tax=Rohdeia mirabilis TaxID=2528008 RepID=A0A518CY01_9BACT|nr:Glycerol-3-phosphate acyltransferase [Planctomycetes bacterium Pla163]